MCIAKPFNCFNLEENFTFFEVQAERTLQPMRLKSANSSMLLSDTLASVTILDLNALLKENHVISFLEVSIIPSVNVYFLIVYSQ